MTRKLLSLASLAIALGMATLGLADAVPNFAGTWVLNTDKGQNLGMVKAVSETVVITQTPARLTADFSSTFMLKTTRRQVNYDLTGKTSIPNEGPMGDKADTLARWDGNKLVVSWTSEGAVAGTKIVKIETRALSADGKTMSVATQRPGKDVMELVYEKK